MPSELLSCSEAQAALIEIKSLKTEFDRAYAEAIKTGDLTRSKELRSIIERKMASLREAVFPLERELNLNNQYETQRNILEHAGILEHLPSGKVGIMGIDGRSYPIPSYQEIVQRMRERKDLLTRKHEQGFTKLLMVPFGMSLDDFITKYRETILRHHREGKLFGTKKDPTDPDTPLPLDTNKPVSVWDEYRGADRNGTLVYYPTEFSERHGGFAKEALVAQGDGWIIHLIEDLPNIPRSGHGKTMGKRTQFETNKSPKAYLERLDKEEYKAEIGMTPEDQITYAILHLEETNEIIDDVDGNGSISYQIGAYFPAQGGVPLAYWDRHSRRAYLDWDDPALHGDRIGARSAVRV